MKNRTLVLLLIFALCVLSWERAEAQYAVRQSVFGSGSGVLYNDDYLSAGIAGQPAIGSGSNESYSMQAGFLYQAAELATAVEQVSDNLPTEFRLEQNYPNPFNPSTTIHFALPKHTSVSLRLYDMLGREVATLVDEELQPGVHQVVFDAGELPSGVYFYRIRAEGFRSVKKLMLVR